MEQDESNFLRHIPCDNCGSSDANSLYSDGHQFCFSCQAHVKGDGTTPAPSPKKRAGDLITGEFMDLSKRKIREDTCRKFGYQVGELAGKKVQIAPYYDKSGTMVAQKIRGSDKSFKVLGNITKALPFGAPLWGKGKKLVVTEGEIDAMSVSQAQGNKWAVVSVPNGAQGAKKHMGLNFDYYDILPSL